MIRGFRKVEAETEREWLPLMPVDRFQYAVKWVFGESSKRPSFVSLSGVTARRQSKIPSEGLTKPAPPGFTLFNLEAAHTWTINKRRQKTGNNLELGLSVFNLTNVAYREYLDLFRYFVDMPGVNIAARAKYVFGD
jgi:iron complex outermembrane receptor protein